MVDNLTAAPGLFDNYKWDNFVYAHDERGIEPSLLIDL